MSTIVTNSQARPLVPWIDLPSEAKKVFTYVGREEVYTNRFVQYLGEWYDVHDAQRIGGTPFGFPAHGPFVGWDGISTDSAFSGVVFRYPNDQEVHERDLYNERYDVIIVGRWSS